jgi:hypothetical protein
MSNFLKYYVITQPGNAFPCLQVRTLLFLLTNCLAMCVRHFRVTDVRIIYGTRIALVLQMACLPASCCICCRSPVIPLTYKHPWGCTGPWAAAPAVVPILEPCYYWLSDMQVIFDKQRGLKLSRPVWSVSREGQPLLVADSGTAVLYMLACASLCKRQPTTIHATPSLCAFDCFTLPAYLGFLYMLHT